MSTASNSGVEKSTNRLNVEVQRVSSFKTVKRPVIKKRNEDKVFKLFSGPSKPKYNGLTLDVLQSLTPFKNGVDLVAQESRDLLLNCIKLHPSVHEVFFPEVKKDLRITDEDLRGFPIHSLAVAVICEVISKGDDPYKFYCMIEKNNLENVLTELYTNVHWKKLGFSMYCALYPSVVRDARTNISLQDFIDDDGPEWAERIIERMTEPSWTMGWVQKIVRGHVTEEEYNMAMNTLFVKLHMLDPQSVIPTFHLLNHIRALPECNLELATRDYLGGPLDAVALSAHARTAVTKETMPSNGTSRMSLDKIEVFYGIDVDEFIMTEARKVGVWNGRRPDNKRTSDLQDRCSVM
ncbi:uncharacterized protein LOC127850883 [Dreissena polymorpha]|uniref:Uncharacterized protein n=1 Tax=Dreissena polymorpha TaxID=45954 RepID=A0A9D4D7N7_DREPO|nr:uncharacterized protein LOC127850883 [Dreissena polymorpha]XP_052240236.1 uncharacterized protein LOC127850883 [Dreissena polymorpha]KAH3740162.1 hypothetical protein DPMN_046857 [Dreissena polymorpha]